MANTRARQGLMQVKDLPLANKLRITPDAPAETVAILKRMEEVARTHPSAEDVAPTGEIAFPHDDFCQLDLWPGPERGSPNEFLRSALFAAIQSENRQQIQTKQAKQSDPPTPVAIVTQRGFSIAYMGQQLDQYDFDVWLQAIHWAKAQPVGTECIFHGHAFLQEIGRTRGQVNYDLLNKSLTRLAAGLVVIKHQSVTFTGHLISSFTRDDETGVYKITLADEILKLFGYSSFTRLQWDERRALKGKALALWLHGFYSSHARPYPLTIDYLRRLCGSRNAELRSFRAKLKKAFQDLEKASGMKATFTGDTVTVERQPSGSQAKYLAALPAEGKRS